jgi:hypothetical protein
LIASLQRLVSFSYLFLLFLLVKCLLAKVNQLLLTVPPPPDCLVAEVGQLLLPVPPPPDCLLAKAGQLLLPVPPPPPD